LEHDARGLAPVPDRAEDAAHGSLDLRSRGRTERSVTRVGLMAMRMILRFGPRPPRGAARVQFPASDAPKRSSGTARRARARPHRRHADPGGPAGNVTHAVRSR